MMTVQLKIDGSFVDVTPYVKMGSVKRSFSLYKDLAPNSNTCNFVLERTIREQQSLISYFLLTNNDIDVLITKDGQPFFAGIVSPNWIIQEVNRGIQAIEVKCEDYTISKLNKEITTNISLTNNLICTTNGVNSIVHVLAAGAGITVTSAPSIPITINQFSANTSESKTYGGLLRDLLFEAGYTYYLDEAGSLVLYKLWMGYSKHNKGFPESCRYYNWQ